MYSHHVITANKNSDDDDLRIFESQLPKMRSEGNNLALTSRSIPDNFVFRVGPFALI